jgi:hypothetical protein
MILFKKMIIKVVLLLILILDRLDYCEKIKFINYCKKFNNLINGASYLEIRRFNY